MEVQAINIIVCPYHVGLVDHRVGLGPSAILAYRDGALQSQLHSLGYTVKVTTIGPTEEIEKAEGEIGRSFLIFRLVARAVAEAVAQGDFPVVLAGNCNVEVGVQAGINLAAQGSAVGVQPAQHKKEVIWFDAHADFDSPEETVSGYFDGMGASMLVGECWHALMNTVPGHVPFRVEDVVFVGVRDLSTGQRNKLQERGVRAVYGIDGDTVKGPVEYSRDLESQLRTSDDRRSNCSVHIDLDCLDTSIGQANEYAIAGGLMKEDLLRCMRLVADLRKPVSLTVASFNPQCPGADAIAAVAVQAILQLMKSIQETKRKT